MVEVIHWTCADTQPDDDTTVLVSTAEAVAHPGYVSGGEWFWASGLPIVEDVVAWAETPTGPGPRKSAFRYGKLRDELQAAVDNLREYAHTLPANGERLSRDQLEMLVDVRDLLAAASKLADKYSS